MQFLGLLAGMFALLGITGGSLYMLGLVSGALARFGYSFAERGRSRGNSKPLPDSGPKH